MRRELRDGNYSTSHSNPSCLVNGNLAKEFVNKKIFVLYVMHID